MEPFDFPVSMPHFINLDRLSLPSRPADARAQLERVLSALVEVYHAERIIVFGSCVHATATDDSDIDLLVIRDHPPECTHPALEAMQAIGTTRPLISTDLLVRTPQQWRAEQARPFGVFQEIVDHGLPVYEG